MQTEHPASAEGVECVRFGREMEGDNINAPLLSHDGSCMALSLFQRRPRQASGVPDAIVQASAIHLHVGDGEQWKHPVLLSEYTISVPV